MNGPTLKSLVESMFEVVKSRSTHEELGFICPVPGCGDQSGNRSVNLKTGKTNCWRCNVGGDFIKWARWLGYAVEENDTASLSLEELYKLLDPPPRTQTFIPVISPIKMPPGWRTCWDYPDSAWTKQIGQMAIRKNLELEDLVQAGVGYVMEGVWSRFAVFPVMEYDRIVYFQGRTYWDEPGESTKKFPSRSEAPLSSKYWIYGIDNIKPHMDTVVVVESILNVLSLQKKFNELGITNMVPICVFKHSVSKTQFLKLLRFKHIKEAILLFDFDAIDLSWKDAKKVDDLIRVSIAEMPFSADNKKLDPNDDVEAAMIAIGNRKPYSMLGVLSRKIESTANGYYAPPMHDVIVDQGIATKCLHPEARSLLHDDT